MNNFIAFNPTKLHFGRGVVSELGTVASQFGRKALLIYGGGSVLRNGSYQETLDQLKQNNIDVTEYNGIKPNPRVDDVNRAALLGRDKEVDMVVAVGGGSVIDSAKICSICIADDCDAWKVITGKHEPTGAIPLIGVLTLAATGTEMNGVAVLQNPETREKIGFKNDLIYPAYSFLDPVYTQSIPAFSRFKGLPSEEKTISSSWMVSSTDKVPNSSSPSFVILSFALLCIIFSHAGYIMDRLAP